MAPRAPRKSKSKSAVALPENPKTPPPLTHEVPPSTPPEKSTGLFAAAVALAQEADTLPIDESVPSPPVFTDTKPNFFAVNFRPPVYFVEQMKTYFPQHPLSLLLKDASLSDLNTPQFWKRVHTLNKTCFDTPKEVVQAAAALGKVVFENSVPILRGKNKRLYSQSRSAYELLKSIDLHKRYKRLTDELMHENRPVKSKFKGLSNPVHNQRHIYAIALFFQRALEASNLVCFEQRLDAVQLLDVDSPVGVTEEVN